MSLGELRGRNPEPEPLGKQSGKQKVHHLIHPQKNYKSMPISPRENIPSNDDQS